MGHIEESGLVNLPNRAAMVAFDVVGIDFEHGLSVHVGVRRHTQVGIGFDRLGFLSIRSHQDASGEGSDGFSVQHIFIEDVALTIRHRMVDDEMVVDMLQAGSDHTAE